MQRISVDEFLACKNISDLQILIQHEVDACIDFSIEMIEKIMPLTFEFLKQKPKEYKSTWEISITRPEPICLALKKIKEGVTNY